MGTHRTLFLDSGRYFHGIPRPRVDLLDMPRRFDMIQPMAKVKAVVYGHSYEFGFSQYKGIHLINLPATGFNMSHCRGQFMRFAGIWIIRDAVGGERSCDALNRHD